MKRIISMFILISMAFVMVGCVPLEERPKHYFEENDISYWKLNDNQCAVGQYWLLPDESTHSYAAGSL